MTDGWRVEEASAAALPSLLAIARASFREPWSAAALRAELAREDVRCLVARDARGEPAGYLLARRVLDELQVSSVAVAPGRRGRGVGRALLEAALAREGARGLRVATLEVRAGSEAALALYRAAGFEVVGRRPRYYRGGEDALLLDRPFPDPAP